MAVYVLEYRYADLKRRARARPRHLDYVGGLHRQGKVLMAGTLADGTGAIVVYEASDEAEVRRLIEDDPYSSEGVTAEVTLREWAVAIPAQS